VKKIFWSCFTNQDRTTTLREVEEIVSRHGYILDFRQYSDLTLVLCIEIMESKIEILYQDLSKSMRISVPDKTDLNGDKECSLYLNITMPGSGKHTTGVPAVPG
jgi:hypothetical protein